MRFEEKDQEVCKQITQSLWQRHRINANKLDGSMPLQPEWEDRVTPEITITENAIKDMSGRDKIRAVVLNKYEETLKNTPGIKVVRVDNTLKVSIEQRRERSNEFASLKALRAANEADLSKDASLDDPLF